MSIGWTETIVAVDKDFVYAELPDWPKWKPIYRGEYMQLWTCGDDLKDSFHDYATEFFGKTLQQIVRLGSYPAIEYTRE